MKPPYEITQTILDLYGRINEALGFCKSLLLIKPEARLRKENRIKTIHSSLAIEGNTLDIEYVTALMNNVHVVGPQKDILEVQNAIVAYDNLPVYDPYSIQDFLNAHSVFMKGLIENPGHFRTSQVGILKGREVAHIAPSHTMVPGLMQDLFYYIQHDADLGIIKSCVFHYEMEFIHPFEDGNGRMGRYWQTRLLMTSNPIFEFVPIEKVMKDHQEEYYDALARSDTSGSSTAFIEFMLRAINASLREMIEETKALNIDFKKRTTNALSVLEGWFDRKAYMKVCKDISSATASRDLRRLLGEHRIEASGTGRMTQYKKVHN
jgi:Fic family protein